MIQNIQQQIEQTSQNSYASKMKKLLGLDQNYQQLKQMNVLNSQYQAISLSQFREYSRKLILQNFNSKKIQSVLKILTSQSINSLRTLKMLFLINFFIHDLIKIQAQIQALLTKINLNQSLVFNSISPQYINSRISTKVSTHKNYTRQQIQQLVKLPLQLISKYLNLIVKKQTHRFEQIQEQRINSRKSSLEKASTWIKDKLSISKQKNKQKTNKTTQQNSQATSFNAYSNFNQTNISNTRKEQSIEKTFTQKNRMKTQISASQEKSFFNNLRATATPGNNQGSTLMQGKQQILISKIIMPYAKYLLKIISSNINVQQLYKFIENLKNLNKYKQQQTTIASVNKTKQTQKSTSISTSAEVPTTYSMSSVLETKQIWKYINILKYLLKISQSFPTIFRYYKQYYSMVIFSVIKVMDFELKFIYPIIQVYFSYRLSKIKLEIEKYQTQALDNSLKTSLGSKNSEKINKKVFSDKINESTLNNLKNQSKINKLETLEQLIKKYQIRQFKQIVLQINQINQSIIAIYMGKYTYTGVKEMGLKSPELAGQNNKKNRCDIVFDVLKQVQKQKERNKSISKKMSDSKQKNSRFCFNMNNEDKGTSIKWTNFTTPNRQRSKQGGSHENGIKTPKSKTTISKNESGSINQTAPSKQHIQTQQSQNSQTYQTQGLKLRLKLTSTRDQKLVEPLQSNSNIFATQNGDMIRQGTDVSDAKTDATKIGVHIGMSNNETNASICADIKNQTSDASTNNIHLNNHGSTDTKNAIEVVTQIKITNNANLPNILVNTTTIPNNPDGNHQNIIPVNQAIPQSTPNKTIADLSETKSDYKNITNTSSELKIRDETKQLQQLPKIKKQTELPNNAPQNLQGSLTPHKQQQSYKLTNNLIAQYAKGITDNNDKDIHPIRKIRINFTKSMNQDEFQSSKRRESRLTRQGRQTRLGRQPRQGRERQRDKREGREER